MTYTVGGSATSARHLADSNLAASPQLFVSRASAVATMSPHHQQQPSTAAVLGAAKYGATAATAAHISDELKAQNRYLERQVDYLQSVSSVFRQKMAVMLRDCVRNASNMNPVDLQRLYANAMEEIARAERDMLTTTTNGTSVGDEEQQQQRLFGGEEAVDEPTATTTTTTTVLQRVRRTTDAKEDVRKAHLICIALQEKNDLKEKLIAVNRELADVREKFEDLMERHRRLVSIQTAAAPPGSAVASIKELYEERIRELEDTVLQLKSDNVKLRISGGGGKVGSAVAAGSPSQQGGVIAALKGESAGAPVPLDGDVSPDDVEKLVKQNQLLKARIHRMKQEESALKQQSITSTEQLQHGLDSLLARIAELQSQLDDKDALIHQLTNEKRELAKECVAHRGQVEMYVKQLELFVKDSDIAQLSHARKANATRGEAENLSSAVDEYLQQIHQKDEVIQNLMNQLRDEKRKHQERVLETRALGVQLETFRAKLDAVQAQQHQREQQQQLLSGIEHRLLSAVQDIHQTQNTSALSGKLDQLSQKLKLMEHVDLQLRQKEDELVLLKDELEQTREEKEELLATLTSISQMFIRFPKTVGEVERMMVQLEEVQRELALCAQQHCTPDPLRVEGKVELRMLELQGRVNGRTKGSSGTTPQQRRHSGSATATAIPAVGSASRGAERKHGGGGSPHCSDDASDSRLPPPLDDDDVWERQLEAQLAELMNVPPLPTLESLQLPLREEQPAVSTAATLSAVSPVRSGAQTAAQAGLGFTSPSGGPGSVHDVHLTFQLFDDEGAGVLSADMIRLCLATLGITRALPPAVTHMTEDQFLAFCCGHDVEA